MKKTELKALIKEAFLAEQKNTLLNESAPGFENRQQGEALPTLESIKAAYQAKKLEEAEIEDKKLTYSDFVDMVRADMRAGAANDENASENQIERVARWKYDDYLKGASVDDLFEATKEAEIEEAVEDTKEETKATKELTAAVKDLDDAKEEAGLKEDKFVDAALEDLRTVINNLAHTSGMGIEEAAEMAMMHIEDMFMGGEEEEDMMQEGTPTVFDDKSMDDLLNIILKYVEDPADAEKELERFDAGGFEAMSDSVQANLDRDEEYKAWYNKLHSIKEEEVEEGVEKDYWADYTDIGMFYLDGLGMENTLTDDQFEKLGEKIVKQLYGGDVGKAYDDIVRGKKQRSGTELEEGEKVDEMVALKSIGMMYDKDSKVLHPMKKDGTADLDVDVHVDDLDDEVHAKISDEDAAKLNESVIAEGEKVDEMVALEENFDPKSQIKFFNSLKVGDKVKYNSVEKNGIKKGDEVVVDSIKSSPTFEKTITVKKGNKKVIVKATNGLKSLNIEEKLTKRSSVEKHIEDFKDSDAAKLNESVITEADMIVESFRK